MTSEEARTRILAGPDDNIERLQRTAQTLQQREVACHVEYLSDIKQHAVISDEN